jgi:hypothetical protein
MLSGGLLVDVGDFEGMETAMRGMVMFGRQK